MVWRTAYASGSRIRFGVYGFAMRAGVFVPQGWRLDLIGIPPDEQWSVMHDVAVSAEVDGFESVWVYDHFHTVPMATQEPTHEAWTIMGALAVTTSRVRLGQMCTCNAYRPPAYLAKVAATVDVLSGGRVGDGHRSRLVRGRVSRQRL